MNKTKITKNKIEKIRESFKSILDEKLEKIITERNKKLEELKKMTKNKLEKIKIEGEKKILDLHKYTFSFLDLISMVKKEGYFTKEILGEYNQRYYNAIGYQFRNYEISKGVIN